MATSGTATFSRNRDQLIASALRKINAFEQGETPDSASVSEASDALNAMVKHWQGSGIEIWTTQEAVIFPQPSQTRYTLGDTTDSDHAAAVDEETTLSAAAVLGATSVTVDDITGIGAGYNIGIQLDDGTFQWTTVNGTPSGSTISLVAALTDSASDGNAVIAYQTELVRPLKIISARRHNLVSDIDVPLMEMDRVEYQEMPNKTSTGEVNSFYYDRRGGTNTTGYLYLWPAPANTSEIIRATVARPVEDFNSAGDDADLPQEWIRAIEWNLADELADEYDVPEPKRSRIERRAAQYLAEANWWERELLSIEFVPDTGR
jgi:hypothetical protein